MPRNHLGRTFPDYLGQTLTNIQFDVNELHSKFIGVRPPCVGSHDIDGILAWRTNQDAYEIIIFLGHERATSLATAKRDVNNDPLAVSGCTAKRGSIFDGNAYVRS